VPRACSFDQERGNAPDRLSLRITPEIWCGKRYAASLSASLPSMAPESTVWPLSGSSNSGAERLSKRAASPANVAGTAVRSAISVSCRRFPVLPVIAEAAGNTALVWISTYNHGDGPTPPEGGIILDGPDFAATLIPFTTVTLGEAPGPYAYGPTFTDLPAAFYQSVLLTSLPAGDYTYS
jgi:hypothetical protein